MIGAWSRRMRRSSALHAPGSEGRDYYAAIFREHASEILTSG
jgi:hypothetical protein